MKSAKPRHTVTGGGPLDTAGKKAETRKLAGSQRKVDTGGKNTEHR